MSPTQVTLQIRGLPLLHATLLHLPSWAKATVTYQMVPALLYKRKIWACSPNDCPPPAGEPCVDTRGEEWALAQDTCMKKTGTAHAYNITWQGTRQPHEIVIMVQHSPIT